jgi:hypothetical protein
MRNRLRPLGPAWALSVAGRVGAENSVTSRDLEVFVYQAAEAVAS